MRPEEQMAYDRAITVFSPDGRLYQVEYARQAVEKASPVVGIVFDSGVVLAATKSLMPLQVPETTEKIFKIDEHIGAGYCGLIADSRVLIDLARVKSQINRITYDEPIEIETLVKQICDRKQQYTQYGGIRPFGVSFLIAGVDTKPRLFETDPSGTHRGWLARAIGRNSAAMNDFLASKYRKRMKKEHAISLAIKTLEKGEKLEKENLEIAVVDEQGFRMLDSSRYL